MSKNNTATPSVDVARLLQAHNPKQDVTKATAADVQAAFDALVERNEAFSPVGEGRNVFICLPQYKATNPTTLFSLLALWNRSQMRCKMHFGDAFISHTRNKLASAFLDSGCEWSLWVDDDMVFPVGDAAWYNGITDMHLPASLAGEHTLNRLLKHGKTLVAGLYFGRSPRGKPMFYEGVNDPNIATRLRNPENLGQLLATPWVGTGVCLIHRKVFEDIKAKFPHLAPKPGSNDDFAFFTPSSDRVAFALAKADATKDAAEREAALAEAIKASKAYRYGVGEDVTFCTRAGFAGHQPYVDTGLVCGHVGAATYGPTNTQPHN